MFTQLPTEIKLSVLSQADSSSLARVCDEWSFLSHYISNRKLNHYLSNHSLSISLFCVNSQIQNKRLFYKLIPQISDDSKKSVSFQLSELIKTEDLLELTNKPKSFQSYQVPMSHLDLDISEEQSSVKIYIKVQLDDNLIDETSIRLPKSQLNQTITKSTKNMIFDIQSQKNSSVQKDEAYQFEEVWGYNINLASISFEKASLVDLIEKQKGFSYFVRC